MPQPCNRKTQTGAQRTPRLVHISPLRCPQRAMYKPDARCILARSPVSAENSCLIQDVRTMSDSQRYPRLARIDAPTDLRKFDEAELPEVARELREYLIESVAGAGGHFGAGLGVIELTVALHYLYDTPADRLVWDVGHQCYPHKILTGRRDRIDTIKKKDGLAP